MSLLDNNASKGSLKSGADLMKIQAQSMADTARQHERDQEDRERRFVSLVFSYLSEQGLVAVPLAGTEDIYAVIHEHLKYRSASASEFYDDLLIAAQGEE